MVDRPRVVIIGGGQAGLALSFWLTRRGQAHVVLEQGRLAESWRSGRWDSFGLVTPNFTLNLPDFPYGGDDPEGFLTRDELIDYFERYAASFSPPLIEGVRVTSVEPSPRGGYQVTSTEGTLEVPNVVVATGIVRAPRVPALDDDFPPEVVRLHASQYRRPDTLPPGTVLVVGSGQSGCQIAEDLHRAGRQVYLSIGSTGRVPRRYRGRDVYWWVIHAGIEISSEGKFSNHAHVSGADGGHSLNLHRFARDGIVLLGRLQGVRGSTILLARDLKDRLADADAFEASFKRAVDQFIVDSGLAAPLNSEADEPALDHGYRQEVRTEVDLTARGITSVIWATGYRPDFDWVRLPVLDEAGFPLQERGVTRFPGLYFLGMNWLTKPKSSFIGTVGAEAEYLASHIS